ncbi:uncharacterized protein LOC105217511 [Zeugodacus cucurbitae]|uniref:uncharacterized protein LOC105217511 n=1 Tax=Zeugodacus cucurbitae TaxID=28588 RepID=UPI0023D8FB62|nr:uncharacterized protein LOC105217511 [Zeugodacus cucurbitae]
MILNELLTRLRHLKVLLVLPSKLGVEVSPLDLFRWAWHSGYTRIMSLHATTGANGTHITLMSFTPFPELQLITVERPVDYFRYTLPHDFQGHAIRAPLGQNAPSVFSYTDRNGQRKTTGMIYHVFHNFIKLHNATLEEVVLPEPYPDVVLMESVIAALQRGQLDISLHFYFMDYEKWHINQPPFLFANYFRVPNAKPRPIEDYVWAPFRRKVWNAIFLYLLFIALILTFGYYLSTRIEWLHKASKKEYIGRVSSEMTSPAIPRCGSCSTFKLNRKPFSRIECTHLLYGLFQYLHIFIDTFLQLLASLCFTANKICRRSYYNRRLSSMFIFHSILAFILVNYYSALSVSFLTTGIFEPQMNSIADVIDSPYKIQLTHTDIPYFPKDADLRRKVEIISRSEMWQHHLTLNNSVILLNTLWSYNFFSSQQMKLHQKPVRLLKSEIVWDAMSGMLMPLNSPYVEMLTDTLLWSFNTGLFRKAYIDTWGNAFEAGILHLLPIDHDSEYALDMHYFYWAWWVCIVGYLLSSVVLLIERFCHKKTK